MTTQPVSTSRPTRRPSANRQRPASRHRKAWLPDRVALAPAAAGAVLWWAALPPLALWPLAWVAVASWVWMIRRPELPGRRPYVALWLSGLTFWLATIHWLRLPHAATSIGWVALSLYLSAYLPAFVAVSRVGVHRWRLPAVVVAPIVWTGLELAQSHLLTGFNLASLAHTQFLQVGVIQIADLAGAYGLTFMIVLVGACVGSLPPCDGGKRWRIWPIGVAAAALLGVWTYGYACLKHEPGAPATTIALIQGSITPEVKGDPGRDAQTYGDYLNLSHRALAERQDVAALVWPETMFPGELIEVAADAAAPAKIPIDIEATRERAARNEALMRATARGLDRPMIVGIDSYRLGRGTFEAFNSAVPIGRDGMIGERYDKMHPVMFGEYIPLAKHIPWLYTISPLGAGIERGANVPVMEVDGLRLVANICFESTLPHLIRRQIASASAGGHEPDALVNLTNDGWFRGSSELDLHLACGVFRAVELRKPFLIAANTGISASIDGSGRIQGEGARGAEDVVYAEVARDGRHSAYRTVGDWPAGFCLAVAVVMAIDGLRRRKSGAGATPRTA